MHFEWADWISTDFKPDYGYRLAYISELNPKVYYVKVVGWFFQKSKADEGEVRVVPAVIEPDGIEPRPYDFGNTGSWDEPIRILHPNSTNEELTEDEINEVIAGRKNQVDEAIQRIVDIVKAEPGIRADKLIDAVEKGNYFIGHNAAMKGRTLAEKQGLVVSRKLEDKKSPFGDGWSWFYFLPNEERP